MLISVIMSVYNGRSYLKEAVDSILRQTYADFEFIIIDDGSTDGSIEILEKYAAMDTRIVLLKNKSNIGLPGSLNKGIKLAKGEYIARQDADDISSLSRLETQLKFALEHPEIDIIGSDCFLIDIKGDVICSTSNYSKITDYQSCLLNRKAIFPHGSAFIKKEKLIEAGLYDTRFYYSQDGELWLRLIKNGCKVHTMSKPLYYYRAMPSKNAKKDHAQQSYNNVKQMIYLHKSDEKLVDNEITRIRETILNNLNAKPIPFYMARYWKNLANTAYFNDCKKFATPYKYLFRALTEKNAAKDYLNYLKLALVYIFPYSLVKSLLNLTGKTAA